MILCETFLSKMKKKKKRKGDFHLDYLIFLCTNIHSKEKFILYSEQTANFVRFFDCETLCDMDFTKKFIFIQSSCTLYKHLFCHSTISSFSSDAAATVFVY